MAKGQLLVAMTGLPGTGKSTIAEAVARAISAPVFSVDPLEATLNRAGITREHRSGYAAYDLVATLADTQLRLGQSAVVDAVNAEGFLRTWWKEIAEKHGVRAVTIATTCSDLFLHRERIETRDRGIEGFLYELSWPDVEAAMLEYEPAVEADITVDAAQPLAGNIQRALAFVAATLGA